MSRPSCIIPIYVYYFSWRNISVQKVSRYQTAVYARDMDRPDSDWVKMPDLLDARMWQGCVVTQISDQRGILVIGGK